MNSVYKYRTIEPEWIRRTPILHQLIIRGETRPWAEILIKVIDSRDEDDPPSLEIWAKVSVPWETMSGLDAPYLREVKVDNITQGKQWVHYTIRSSFSIFAETLQDVETL